MQKIYPSKLLIFGEYAVLSGGEALAIPYPVYSAHWIKNAEVPTAYKKYLILFAKYLSVEKEIAKQIDVHLLQQDLEKGLDMQSDIPIGYGTGSSGAVVAAVYDKYCLDKTKFSDIRELKIFLGLMEDFFHKKSSGLDPLVCYIQKPLIVRSDGSIEIISAELSLLSKLGLYDTGISRFTQNFVEIFQGRMKDDDYKNEVFQKYLEVNHKTVDAFLKNESSIFFKSLRKLSAFQLEYFNFAIPPSVRDIWMDELNHGKKIMKLCGAGGGGFMIYFTEE